MESQVPEVTQFFFGQPLSYALPEQPGQSAALPDFYVKPTFDGHPASAGNGAMIAFEARSQKQVRDLHSAALAAGGFDEGQPGFRDSYGPHFYVGYLRDPLDSSFKCNTHSPTGIGCCDGQTIQTPQ